MIAGILVVRLPEQNFDPEARGAFSSIPPRVGGICYGGIERMPWFDLDEDHYKGTLPADLEGARRSLVSANRDFTGIKLCYDIIPATQCLEWSNRVEPFNEMIVIGSQKLVEIKHRSLQLEPQGVEWLGFDFVALGHWSLLAAGLFAAPSYFGGWSDDLNEYGLMSNPNKLEEYAEAYSLVAKKRAVEPLPEEVYGLDAVGVGRLRS